MFNYIEMSPKPNPIGVMSKISLNLYSVKLTPTMELQPSIRFMY